VDAVMIARIDQARMKLLPDVSTPTAGDTSAAMCTVESAAAAAEPEVSSVSPTVESEDALQTTVAGGDEMSTPKRFDDVQCYRLFIPSILRNINAMAAGAPTVEHLQAEITDHLRVRFQSMVNAQRARNIQKGMAGLLGKHNQMSRCVCMAVLGSLRQLIVDFRIDLFEDPLLLHVFLQAHHHGDRPEVLDGWIVPPALARADQQLVVKLISNLPKPTELHSEEHVQAIAGLLNGELFEIDSRQARGWAATIIEGVLCSVKPGRLDVVRAVALLYSRYGLAFRGQLLLIMLRTFIQFDLPHECEPIISKCKEKSVAVF